MPVRVYTYVYVPNSFCLFAPTGWHLWAILNHITSTYKSFN